MQVRVIETFCDNLKLKFWLRDFLQWNDEYEGFASFSELSLEKTAEVQPPGNFCHIWKLWNPTYGL